MDENTLTIIVLALVVILILVVPPWRVRRAVPSIISKFREARALDEQSAKTPEELGIKSVVMPVSLLGGGDPRQTALSTLRESGIVIMTSDGRLYLSEANFARSKWNTKQKT